MALGAGVASAATPTAGEWTGDTKPTGGNDSGALFRVQGNQIVRYTFFFDKKWQAIIAPTSFKCNHAFMQLTVKTLAVKNGKFAYHGKFIDTAGNKPTGITGRLDWTGTFTSPTKVSGTVRVRTAVTPAKSGNYSAFKTVKKPCDTGQLKWSGIRVGK